MDFEKAKMEKNTMEKRLAFEQERLNTANENIIHLSQQLSDSKASHEKEVTLLQNRLLQYENELQLEASKKKDIENQYQSNINKKFTSLT